MLQNFNKGPIGAQKTADCRLQAKTNYSVNISALFGSVDTI